MPTDDEFSTEESTEDTGFDDSTEDTSTEDTGFATTRTAPRTPAPSTTTPGSTTAPRTPAPTTPDRGHQHRGHQFDDSTEDTSTDDTGFDDSTEDTSTDDTGFDDTATDGGTFTGDGSGAVGSELEPPFLVADQYPLDSGPHPPWTNLVDAPNFVGAILKAWEGLQYNDGGWFTNNWSAVRDAGGDRYGQSWFRGAYLFLRFASDGAAQADAYLRAVDKAGGWDHGDIIPVVDVELGSEKNSNFKASAEQIVDCTSACADRIRSETGRRVML